MGVYTGRADASADARFVLAPVLFINRAAHVVQHACANSKSHSSAVVCGGMRIPVKG